MLSLQNPHHMGAAAAVASAAAGPMPPRRQFPPSPSRIPQDPMGSTTQLSHQRSLSAGFKAVMSKLEKNGNDESVPDENDCAPRSHSHGSTSGSGSFSGSGERRKLKRRREEEENAEDDRMDEEEEDGNRGSRRRLESIWIHGKNKSEEDDDEEEEVDDDDDEEEEEVVEGGSDDGVIQKEILTQKPLGLLAQHGLSSRTPSAAKFHLTRKNSHDDEGIEEDEEEKRRNGGMREDEEDDGVRNGRREKEEPEMEAGGGGNRPEESFFVKSLRGSEGQRRLYSSHQSDGDEEQAVAENVLSSRGGCQDIGNFASHISLMDQRFMPSPPLSASPESGQDPSTPGGHHWTFEEQFKQLYELTDDPNRKLFLDDLFSFMQKRGTPVNRIPIMAKQTLDLFELFQLVVSKGGLVEVINKKLWREITKGLNLPSSITSAAFTLRTQYMKYLYPYECEKLKLSTLSELQYAVDGNRREGRRSGFGQDFSPLPPIMPMNPAAVAHMHDSLSAVNQAGRSAVSMSLKDRGDQQMILAPTVNQLRTLAECDAHAVKAATRAMAEVTKRMEEATRAAAVSNTLRFVGGQGQGPPSCPQSTNNVSMKTEEPVTKRPTLEDGVRFPTPLHRSNSSGVSTAHIKLTSRENGHSNHLGSSIIGSMEINGILYQGVLFAQPQPTHLLD